MYGWAWVPAAAATLLLALLTRPRIASAETRALDLMLAASLLAIAVQLVPMPYGMIAQLDPRAPVLRAALGIAAPPGMPFPISIRPNDTLDALGIFATSVVFYWVCRSVCGRGGTGRIIRFLAFFGFALAILAIVQHSPNQELLYGLWRPREAGARPYGPFVNRNHFATWLVMAAPLVFGYLLARVPAARDRMLLSQRVVAAAKQLGSIRIWLAAAVCVMVLAVVLSASRSGMIALVGGLLVSAILSRGHHASRTGRWTIFQGVLVVAVVLAFANFGAISTRIDQTLSQRPADRGRTAIWGDAAHIVRDFPLTGTGAGTFAAAIAPYQTAEPEYSIGQAHNHYLQLAADGGALVVIPAALALAAFLLLFAHRLGEDASATFLIRAGAGAGIAAVLLQSIWETGLRMPANAMLLAFLAAVATHRESC